MIYSSFKVETDGFNLEDYLIRDLKDVILRYKHLGRYAPKDSMVYTTKDKSVGAVVYGRTLICCYFDTLIDLTDFLQYCDEVEKVPRNYNKILYHNNYIDMKLQDLGFEMTKDKLFLIRDAIDKTTMPSMEYDL